MRKKTPKIPKMLKEVWKMKDRVYRDTCGMSADEYFSYIKKKCDKNKLTKKTV
jgi:hypothetical protein